MPIEALLVPRLAADMGIRFTTELPDNLQDEVPLARIAAIGGGSEPNNFRFTSPRLSVVWFEVGYGPAAELAERGRAAFHALAGVTLGRSTITRVDTVSLPAWVPYPDTAIRQFASSFQLHVMTR